jgi:lysophospholipase L1-like esterase
MVATGTGWTCTDYSTGSDPTCTHQGGLAAGSTLPPLTLTGPVPAQDAPATVRAEVRVQNASDAFTNDNYTYLETAITTFSPGGGYVALGDSYSSGEGVPDASGQFIPPSNSPSPNDRCHRSYYAYSQDVIGNAGFPPATMTAFWACSGAIIADYTHPNAKNNEPSQQSHLLRPDGSPDSSIALVSLTMGGNDVEFPSVMFSCTRILKCEKLEDPIVTLLINHTEPRLAQLYGEILRDAPKARIFVLGYPRIVASIPSLKCQLAGIEPSEATWFNKKAAQLDNAISKAVSQVANARLHFVSTLNAFAGGEACSRSGSTGGTYMNGVDLTHIEYSFHPNQAGQEILASLLAHAVRGS